MYRIMNRVEGMGKRYVSYDHPLRTLFIAPIMDTFIVTHKAELEWASYKKEDGHQRDGFVFFCMRLAE